MDLADLDWDDRFSRELPRDPEEHNRVRQVRAVWSRVQPSPVAAPKLLAWSPEVAQMLGLSSKIVHSDGFTNVFGGNALTAGMVPYAQNYGGHQFGNWAGQLGDGRAITLGELRTPTGEVQELQLKGAGPTPYSRGGDGRAVLRSSIREFLCSEAMHHLGIPTTRALSLVSTGDQVMRDMFYDGRPAPEPGAIVCRVAPSFLRFGSFQIHASRGDEETLTALLDHTLRHHFPTLGEVGKDSALALIEEVGRSTAVLMAHWMRVGFVHGVMNTDNMSILGLTMDYGPYGWIDDFDLDWTPNTTDASQRRYRFGQQPQVALWNLARFAEALFPFVKEVSALEGALTAYQDRWTAEIAALIVGKLGLLEHRGEADDALWTDLTAMLQLAETDMTLFFRGLGDVAADSSQSDEALLAPVVPSLYGPQSPHDRQTWLHWLRRWTARVAEDGRTDAARRDAMNAVNPKYVLRNYLAQQAIDGAELGDLSELETVLNVMRRPYDDQPEHEAYAARRPEWARHKAGCSTLSCSS